MKMVLILVLLVTQMAHAQFDANQYAGCDCLGSYEDEEPVMQTGHAEVSNRTKRMAKKFEKEIKQERVEKKIHKGLDTLIKIAAYKLRRTGHKEESRLLLKEWSEQFSSKYLASLYGVEENYHIGDYPSVSQWLKDKMDMLGFVLGKDVLYNLRLSDIITFNSTPKTILWCPVKVSEEEYGLHWISDEEISVRGLAPTVSFWVSEAACLGASLSTGFLLCAPICSGVEWIVKTTVAPKTNHWMWDRACN